MMSRESYLPVALRLDNVPALVVGGGHVAACKLRLLLERCPEIHVLAREAGEEVRQAQEAGRISLQLGDVTAERLQTYVPRMGIVFAATDDPELNRQVARLAREHHIPVCVVDDPLHSSFITPALVDRSPVQVAISTGGASPVLARRLRTRIETLLPSGIGEAAEFMAAQRSWLKKTLPELDARRRVWEAFMDGPGYEAALAGEHERARDVLERLASGLPQKGEAWLVGVGPGDPDLLTLAALRLMQNADCVLYDHLVSEEILGRVRRDAERVFVGKKRRCQVMPQAEINAEMIRRAERGERVLRLKGGDPFVFGRGGEEMEALTRAGVTMRVVPGITAANGCGAAAGIPLTHRECAQSCLFLTGHVKADGQIDLHWPSLVRRGQTLVIYMGLAPLALLCAKLQEHGLPSSWPACVIERGTRADQRVIVGTLEDLPGRVTKAALQGPALILVGEVVTHRCNVLGREEIMPGGADL